MTKSIWPNEYDRNIWTWPKNDNDECELVEQDQKLKKNSHNGEHERLKMTEIKQIRFVGFVHIQTHFRSYWFGQVN